tara:strand:- start:1490 stop:2647 length:1158 start_codon:yes stop_codon:yes gene_type:complete
LLNIRLAIRFIFNLKKSSYSSYSSWLTIIGLSIGVTALMLTASIIGGFKEVVSDKLSRIEGQGRLKHFLNRPVLLDHELLKPIFDNSNNKINPYVRGACMVRKGNNFDGVIVEGISQYPKLNNSKDSNSLKDNQIVLGESLAFRLGAKIGDKIFLQSYSKSDLTLLSSRMHSFEVSNIFYSGIQEYDKNIAYIGLKKAQSLLGFDVNEFTGLIIENNQNLSIDVQYPFYYETWKERHELLFEWMLVQQWPAYIMFGLITFVGLINLFAAITMIVIEKNGPITILLSQGMDITNLRKVFMLQGGIIGILGALLGGIFSVILISIQAKFSLFKIPSEIYFMDQVPFSFAIGKYLIILILVSILSIVASWLPTRSFKNLSPAQILRYE